MRTLLPSLPVAFAAAFVSTAALAGPTTYPLTIENCGRSVTFAKAPERAVALGQNSAEILLLLGLADRMAGTAFWPNEVLPEIAAENAKVDVLTVEFPTLEAVLAKQPDFVPAMLVTLLGPDSKVAKREDFEALGIPTYLSPSACSTVRTTKDAYGARTSLWNMDLVYREIDDLARIFGVADRGEALIARFKAREAALRAKFPRKEGLTFLFWFSSPSPDGDAYLGGGNGPSGYVADLLGGTNAIRTEADWPTLGWEGIMAAAPTVIVAAQVDRKRWDLDRADNKIAFLTSDPTVSQMEAVTKKRIVVMSGAAMNPSIRTLYGAEEIAAQLEALDLP
ncbi:ABC transporter substrate-binding protein [Oharaeibacter diazotrophicus]|uniref:Iron complex transport system substrate-binding protein n=1 Tax=Oharaeibacter diazotrophicus TaxID=1920512 RepID=A0A4R6RAK3_9HYPH|nr:ABC transporter substrate-binding protein [Oharaeibacter diazotrophicus]TDP83151.1 iron complex transport system substrate-binding protein [Oharaeibacter diazotrophicus]BBE71981.1 periplasmic binding protein [Pleomorphomonas sp. SM30]GLS78744.1 ABC transporter substrate-binding protein [Oharaeibacter diazotrophicus]